MTKSEMKDKLKELNADRRYNTSLANTYRKDAKAADYRADRLGIRIEKLEAKLAA